MKAKLTMLIAIIVLCTGSTVWEGSAAVIQYGDLPGGGYCVATNSFPPNTIVDITNLENNKTVRVVVISGQNLSSLLATLSRNAADSIGINSNFTYRIRMTQPSDSIAFSRYQQQNFSPATQENTATANTVTENGANVNAAAETSAPSNEPEATVEPVSVSLLTDTTVVSLPEDTAAEIIPEETIPEETIQKEPEIPSGELSLVPSEERIPEAEQTEIAVENFVEPIENAPVTVTKSQAAPEIQAMEIIAAETDESYIPPKDFSPFQVPLISSLEHDKWYVQVAAFSRSDYVEDEINRIGPVYPVVIQNIGTDINPMFRVLLGPLNQSESGAILQRFKSIGYSDAFVRHN